MAVVDIIAEQDEYASNKYEIVLWPRKWAEYPGPTFDWSMHKLGQSERASIPSGAGVYSILVQPGIADHPGCSYLMYIGKTTSLRRRFGDHLSPERRERGRPKIFRLLHKYSDYLWFCYIELPPESIVHVEEWFNSAYLPPANDQHPADISKVVGAF